MANPAVDEGVARSLGGAEVVLGAGEVLYVPPYYFHEVCDGKISRCKPQIIQEPSGRKRLKEIKIVNGANGKHPRWVLVDYA